MGLTHSYTSGMCPYSEHFGKPRPSISDFPALSSAKAKSYVPSRSDGKPVIDDFEVVDSLGRNPVKGNQHDPSISAEGYAEKYLEFTDTAPTIFHAIAFLARDLEAAGFKYLSERDPWDDALADSKATRFYTVRNGTAIAAWVRGQNWKPNNGMAIIGTHTDSLTLVVKPTSLRPTIDGFEILGAAPYAGALSSPWWDRDLGVGGRIIVREGKRVTSKLVRIPYPIARISTLAPHFGAPAQGPFNKETQALVMVGQTSDKPLEPTTEEAKSPLTSKHSLRLLRALSEHSGVAIRDMLELELHVYDTQPAALGGLDKEFIFAPRIDDKACTYAGIYGLIEAADTLDYSDTLSVVAGYDTEEVGSLSRTGARGNLLEAAVDRILGDIPESDKTVFYANSFFLSADVTHAVNPGFSNVYLEHHKPKLNKGITLSLDPNVNMITESISATLAYEVARRTGDTIQQFQIRNDSRSGGTIGPALSSKTGIRGVDIGIAQLSMHSIRAAMGAKDPWLAIRFFKNFYETWKQVDLEFKLGDL